MVFHSSTRSDASESLRNAERSDGTAAPKQSAAASSPVAPSPLHNFPLSNLRWNRTGASSNAQRLRRQAEKSPAVFPDDAAAAAAGASDAAAEKKAGKAAVVHDVGDAGNQDYPRRRGGDDDGEEVSSKVWNLRPRKPGRSVAAAAQEKKSQSSNRPEGIRQRTGVDAKMAAETRERMRFSLSLTKEEIEEDFFSMTGARPSRRPRRRNKQVQKLIDELYPGSWLEAPLPAMYKTSENSRKHTWTLQHCQIQRRVCWPYCIGALQTCLDKARLSNVKMSKDKDNFNVANLAAALNDEYRVGLVNAPKTLMQMRHGLFCKDVICVRANQASSRLFVKCWKKSTHFPEEQGVFLEAIGGAIVIAIFYPIIDSVHSQEDKWF